MFHPTIVESTHHTRSSLLGFPAGFQIVDDVFEDVFAETVFEDVVETVFEDVIIIIIVVVVVPRALRLDSSSIHGQLSPPLERYLFPKRPFPVLPHVGRDHLVRLGEVKVYHDPDEYEKHGAADEREEPEHLIHAERGVIHLGFRAAAEH